MSSAGIGRLLTASLHQAISERLPARVSFYEPWLSTDGFRTSRVSLAGIRAAFSFLRQEQGAYDAIMQRTGELAADWTWQNLSVIRRTWLRALPLWARRRVAASLARRLASETWSGTRTRVRWRGGAGRLTVEASLFCAVRGAVSEPLCQYYTAGLAQFLRHLALDADLKVDSCLATGGSACVTIMSSVRPMSPVIAAIAFLLLPLLGAGASAAPQDPVHPSAIRARVLVIPFENTSREPRLAWLGEGVALQLTDRLRASGIDALTRDERLQVFGRLQVPPLAVLSRATVIRIGYLVGVSDVITGDLAREGGTVVIRARRIRLDPGILEPDVVERAGAADLMTALERLAGRLGTAAGGPDDPPVDARPAGPSPAAFEQYVKGLIAETPANQVAFLEGALQAYPAYDAARLALWEVQTQTGDHRAAERTARAVADTSPVWADARFLLSLSLMHQGQSAGAVAVLTALQARSPSPVFQNNIGVALLRDPALAARIGHPAYYFGQARTMDGLDPDYVFNLGYAYWTDGDPAGASYWLRECVRLDPTDAAAHALLAQALFASGGATEAGRELVLARRLSSEFDGTVLDAEGSVPRGLERLKEILDPRHARRIDAALEMVGQRDQKDLAEFYLDRGRRLADRELDREAESELTRALYLAPYNAEAHLLLGRIYLRTGRRREAVDAAKVSLWSEETAAAHLVLAEAYLEGRDDAAARAEAQRALVLDPNSIHARKLLERLIK